MIAKGPAAVVGLTPRYPLDRERAGMRVVPTSILQPDAPAPAVLEVELVESSLFLDFAEGSASVLARARLRRSGARAGPLACRA